LSAYKKLDRLTGSYLNAKSKLKKAVLGNLIEREKLKKLQNLKDPKKMVVIVSSEPNSEKVIKTCRNIYINFYSDANTVIDARAAYDLAVSLGFLDLASLSLLKLRSLVGSVVYSKNTSEEYKAQILAFLPNSQTAAATQHS